jgi:hypothetical protein
VYRADALTMSPYLVAAQRFARFERLAGWLACLPEACYPLAARWLAPFLPLKFLMPDWTAACGSALKLSNAAVTDAARLNSQRHALGFLRHHRYERIDSAWTAEHVIDAVCLPPPGSLVLTYHTPEFHLLCSLLGRAGRKVYPLVQAESASPLGQVVVPYLQRLHRGTAKHFNGGSYVFIDPKVSLRSRISELLQAGAVVVVLNDNHHGGMRSMAKSFFGRCIAPRYGAIEVALANGSPIWAGLLEFDFLARKYRVGMQALGGASPSSVLDDYFAFLAENVRRAPDLWDGWLWLSESKGVLA